MAYRKDENRFYTKNKATLIESGMSYFNELQNLIDSSQKIIHLQVYIFEPDETGNRIKNALINAANRGVQVFILLDALGSSSLSAEFIKELTVAGIYFRWFRPLFSANRLQIGRRMHHKVAVADGKTGLVGGINIGNRYNEINGQYPWFDFAVKAEGEIAFQLHLFCTKKWKGFFIRNRRYPILQKFHAQKAGTIGHCKMRIQVNDSLNRKTRIDFSYREAVRQAKEEIIILGAYFLPGSTFIKLLKKASERGVKIYLISGEQSDVWLTQNALHYLYRKLLRSQINIFEYTKSVVHGKALIVDKHFVSVGSYDLNQLSTFINVELNIDIEDTDFATAFHLLMEKTMQKECIQITPLLLNKRDSPVKLFKQWLAYRILRMMFFVTLFLSDKKDY